MEKSNIILTKVLSQLADQKDWLKMAENRLTPKAPWKIWQ